MLHYQPRPSISAALQRSNNSRTHAGLETFLLLVRSTRICHIWRNWLSVIKEPLVTKLRFIQTVFVALLLGLIFFGQDLDQAGIMNINGALFLILTNQSFSYIFAVVNVFCMELPIFLREHYNGMYRTDVYFLCKS